MNKRFKEKSQKKVHDWEMVIPKPVGFRGDRVSVRNYRKIKITWESGTISSLSYECTYGTKKDFKWKYMVLLDRKSPAGNSIILHVSNDGMHSENCKSIKPLK